MDFIYQLAGISRGEEAIAVHFHNEEGDLTFNSASPNVTAKVGIDHTIFGEDFAFLKSVVADATSKITIPSPSVVHFRGRPSAIDRSVYLDDEEFWQDLAGAFVTS